MYDDNDDPFDSFYKLILTYDLQDNLVQEYYQFVLGRYIPRMRTLGWDMVEAWETSYGNGPDRLVTFVNRQQGAWQELLGSEAWAKLNEQLLQYVVDFEYKVVPYRQTFQI
jgi:hypothetical protein